MDVFGQGADPLILGRLDAGAIESLHSTQNANLVQSEEGDFNDPSAGQIIIGADLQLLLEPHAVLQHTSDAVQRRSVLSPLEAKLFELINGQKSVAVLREESDLDEGDLRAALALLGEKQMIERALMGGVLPPVEALHDRTCELDDLPPFATPASLSDDGHPLPFDPPEDDRDPLGLDPLSRPPQGISTRAAVEKPREVSVGLAATKQPDLSVKTTTRADPPAVVEHEPAPLPFLTVEPVVAAPPHPARSVGTGKTGQVAQGAKGAAEAEAAGADGAESVDAELRPAMKTSPLAVRSRPKQEPMRLSSLLHDAQGPREAPEWKAKSALSVQHADGAGGPKPSTGRGDPKRAEEYYEQCLRDIREGRIARAWSYAKMAADANPREEKYLALLRDWNSVTMSGSTRAPTVEQDEGKRLLAESQTAEQRGNYQQAIELMKRACELFPKSAWAYNRLGVLLATRTRDLRGAYDAAFRAVELDSDNAIYRNNMMKVLAKLEDSGPSNVQTGNAAEGQSGLFGKMRRK